MRTGIMLMALLGVALAGCSDAETASGDDTSVASQVSASLNYDEGGEPLTLTLGDENYDMTVYVCGGTGYIFNLSASIDPDDQNSPTASITATEVAEAASQPLDQRAGANVQFRTPDSIDLWTSKVIAEYDHSGKNITISGEMQGVRHPLAPDGTQLWEGIERIDGGELRPFSITTTCDQSEM
ncbi:MAG: hypothetical protein QNI99_21260 [Woeseiaceae bacterium]|nr:hypothetical protein [Woeseiaceae bacterium]